MAEGGRPSKQPRLIQPTTSNIPNSNDSDSDKELTSSTCTGTSSSDHEASCLLKHFMQHWLKLYPWVMIKGSGENLVVYCRDCKRAKLNNDFAHGKKQPSKEKYLQRHGDSNQHKLQAQPTIRMAETAKSHFAPKSVCERETIGLLHNVYFILINGLPPYKSTRLDSLVDHQLKFFGSDEDDGGNDA